MRRTKIKTDNVEQLMEIVRSLQRGEEPTQESIRESAERVSKTDAPMSDEPMSDEPMSDEPESDAQTGEKRTDTEADWDAEDDAFVRSLEETDARISARRERFTKEEEQSAGGRGLGGLWQKAAGYLESRRAQQESEEDDDYEDTEEEALPLDDTEAPKAAVVRCSSNNHFCVSSLSFLGIYNRRNLPPLLYKSKYPRLTCSILMRISSLTLAPVAPKYHTTKYHCILPSFFNCFFRNV